MEGQRRSTPFRCVNRIDEDPFVDVRPVPTVCNREDVLNDVQSAKKDTGAKNEHIAAGTRLDDASNKHEDSNANSGSSELGNFELTISFMDVTLNNPAAPAQQGQQKIVSPIANAQNFNDTSTASSLTSRSTAIPDRPAAAEVAQTANRRVPSDEERVADASDNDDDDEGSSGSSSTGPCSCQEDCANDRAMDAAGSPFAAAPGKVANNQQRNSYKLHDDVQAKAALKATLSVDNFVQQLQAAAHEATQRVQAQAVRKMETAKVALVSKRSLAEDNVAKASSTVETKVPQAAAEEQRGDGVISGSLKLSSQDMKRLWRMLSGLSAEQTGTRTINIHARHGAREGSKLRADVDAVVKLYEAEQNNDKQESGETQNRKRKQPDSSGPTLEDAAPKKLRMDEVQDKIKSSPVFPREGVHHRRFIHPGHNCVNAMSAQHGQHMARPKITCPIHSNARQEQPQQEQPKERKQAKSLKTPKEVLHEATYVRPYERARRTGPFGFQRYTRFACAYFQ
jgi:hypothetical protein